MNNKYQCKFRRDMMEGLMQIIDKLLCSKIETDDDKLLLTVLSQVRHKLYVKLDSVQTAAKFSFTPAESIALRILSTDYVTGITTPVGNKLNQIASDVHKIYL